jgi:hypothetical protein
MPSTVRILNGSWLVGAATRQQPQQQQQQFRQPVYALGEARGTDHKTLRWASTHRVASEIANADMSSKPLGYCAQQAAVKPSAAQHAMPHNTNAIGKQQSNSLQHSMPVASTPSNPTVSVLDSHVT